MFAFVVAIALSQQENDAAVDCAASLTKSESAAASLRERLGAASRDKTALDGEKVVLQRELASANTAKTRLEGELVSANTAKTGLEGEKAALEGEKARLEGELASADAAKTGLGGEKAGLEGELASTNKKLADAKEVINGLRSADKEVEKQLSKLRSEKDQALGLQVKAEKALSKAKLELKESQAAGRTSVSWAGVEPVRPPHCVHTVCASLHHPVVKLARFGDRIRSSPREMES